MRAFGYTPPSPDAIQQSVCECRPVAAEELTVAEFLVRRLSVAKDRTGAPRHVRYAQLCETCIVPAPGGMKLSKVLARHVETFLANMVKSTNEGSVPATAAPGRRRSLQYRTPARFRTRILPSNPADGVTEPKATDREMTLLTGDRAKAFVEAARPCRNSALFTLAVGSGCAWARYWPSGGPMSISKRGRSK